MTFVVQLRANRLRAWKGFQKGATLTLKVTNKKIKKCDNNNNNNNNISTARGQVKSMKTPPKGVKLTMEVCCLMFDVKPNKIKDPESGKKVSTKPKTT